MVLYYINEAIRIDLKVKVANPFPSLILESFYGNSFTFHNIFVNRNNSDALVCLRKIIQVKIMWLEENEI